MEVIGGLEEAQLVADTEGFDLLGEVIPDSNLYQFKEKRINKRSLSEAELHLSQIPNVQSISHQTVNKVQNSNCKN